MTGKIFDIQRFCTNDGPGIRTTVFLKGCPLSCIWCHNPESKIITPEIFFNTQKCLSCRRCEDACFQKQHLFEDNKHIFLRTNCKLCMRCTKICPTEALQICGEEKTSDAVIEEVLKDEEFFKQSDGGLTLSGGEPLMQYDFSLEILQKAKEKTIHTAIETSGYSYRNLNEINKYVDLWLYDIKLITEAEHIKYTGVSNDIILKNLYYLDNLGAKIILRCPVIPDINFTKEHFEEVSRLANSLKNIIAIHIEPYHPLGIDKAIRIGKNQKYNNKNFLSNTDLITFINCMRNKTNVEIEIM